MQRPERPTGARPGQSDVRHGAVPVAPQSGPRLADAPADRHRAWRERPRGKCWVTSLTSSKYRLPTRDRAAWSAVGRPRATGARTGTHSRPDLATPTPPAGDPATKTGPPGSRGYAYGLLTVIADSWLSGYLTPIRSCSSNPRIFTSPSVRARMLPAEPSASRVPDPAPNFRRPGCNAMVPLRKLG